MGFILNIATQLKNVTQGLSPLQRAQLVLRAYEQEERPDPELLRFADRTQGRIFDRYMGLAFIANRELGHVLLGLSAHTERLENHRTYTLLFDSAVEQIEEQEGTSKTPKDWRKLETLSTGELFRGLAKDARTDAVALLTHVCSELAAVEVIWAELTTEFEGVDPVQAGLRQQVRALKERLETVATDLKVRKRPAAPHPDHLVQYRTWIDDGLEQFGHTRLHR
jgi:hypothetical protein